MPTKKELLSRISKLIGAKSPYTTREVGLEKSELELIITQLEYAKIPKVIDGKRQRVMERPAGVKYKKEISLYIKRNLGVFVPPYSTVSARFFNEIIKYYNL